MSRSDARRIVSLVPSVTEALFALGLGERVVGVTDWCVHPAEAVKSLPKLGGTKDPDVAAIIELAPDLVIANQEENTQRSVRELEAAGLDVWVTYPRSVADGVALLEELAACGASKELRERVVGTAVAALETAQQQTPAQRTRVFCPIWRGPWMTIGPDTYAHDLISVCGGENVFASRGERRYPIVQPKEVLVAQPDVVLLPDEPYAFDATHVAEVRGWEVPAARDGRIHLIDGTLVSWYGPRIPRAIATLRSLLAPGGD